MNRRYIAVLALCAAVVLAAGSYARRLLSGEDAPHTAPPSQAAALQQLSQEGQLRRSAAFIAERVASAADYVELVPGAGTGVRWAPDTVVTTDPTRVVVARAHMRAAEAADSGRRPVTVAPDTTRRDWLLVVGRDAGGEVLSATALAGGRSRTRCGDHIVETYVTGGPLDERLVGGGIFNLEGELLGIVAWCGRRPAALPAREIRRVLAAAVIRPDTTQTAYGFAVAPQDSQTRAYTGGDSALLVAAVRRGSPADVAGLQAGDVLVGIDGGPASVGVLRSWRSRVERAETHVVTRRRGSNLATVTLAAQSLGDDGAGGGSSLGIGVRPAAPVRGIPITSVLPGSAAADAGLRPGDRLLRVGGASVTSVADAQRRVALVDAAPTLVAYERDGVERVALLRAPRLLPRITPASRAPIAPAVVRP